MKTHLSISAGFTVVITLAIAGTLGCQPPPDFASDWGSTSPSRSLTAVSGASLPRLVRQSNLPVLVEFGVNYNCPRCEQVKPEVLQLAERLADRVKVVRVDFSTNSSLVSRLGGTTCPTYVLFKNGEPVLTRSFPIAMDMLEGEIERINSEGAGERKQLGDENVGQGEKAAAAAS